MKFTVYHSRYGYIGMEDEPCYTDNDLQNAALFTRESAMRLLVDINDPRMVVTEMTDEQISKLPFTLKDTQKLLDIDDKMKIINDRETQTMTANAMEQAENAIDTLNKTDNIKVYDSLADVPKELLANLTTDINMPEPMGMML